MIDQLFEVVLYFSNKNQILVVVYYLCFFPGALLILDGDRRFDGERMIVRFYSLNGDSFNANNVTYERASKIPEQVGFKLTPDSIRCQFGR